MRVPGKLARKYSVISAQFSSDEIVLGGFNLSSAVWLRLNTVDVADSADGDTICAEDAVGRGEFPQPIRERASSAANKRNDKCFIGNLPPIFEIL